MCQKPQSHEVWFLRCGVRHIESFVISGHFLPFFPSPPPEKKQPRKSKFWKHQKGISRSHYFAHVYQKITIILCMLSEIPEIRSVTDIIFCHFGPFFDLLPHYWPWKLKFGNNVKKPGDIILLHMCSINKDNIMSGSWDIRHEWHRICCHFGPFFVPWPS